MELKIDKSFYMLERKDKQKIITLYDNMDEAVKKVADYIKQRIPSGSITLSIIEVAEDKMTVKGVPWATIAEMLIKDLR